VQLALRKLAGLMVRAGHVLAPALDAGLLKRLVGAGTQSVQLQRLKESLMTTMQLASFSMTVTLVVERAGGSDQRTAGNDAQLRAALRKAAGVAEGAGEAAARAAVADWSKQHPQQLRDVLAKHGGDAAMLLAQGLASQDELMALQGVVDTMRGELTETRDEVANIKVTLQALMTAINLDTDIHAVFSRVQETGRLMVLQQHLVSDDQQVLQEVGRPLTVADIKDMHTQALERKLPALAKYLEAWWKKAISLRPSVPAAKFLSGLVRWFEKEG
jgi:hypothetical protein